MTEVSQKRREKGIVNSKWVCPTARDLFRITNQKNRDNIYVKQIMSHRAREKEQEQDREGRAAGEIDRMSERTFKCDQT